jgi:hypothetical protein
MPKPLGRTATFEQAGVGGQTVEAKQEGHTIWSLNFELQLVTHDKSPQGEDFDFSHTDFDPLWFKICWADIDSREGECEILGWLQDGKGMLAENFRSSSSNPTVKGDIVFAGSAKGKELWINFLNSPTIKMTVP